jgi:hypothetical protein
MEGAPSAQEGKPARKGEHGGHGPVSDVARKATEEAKDFRPMQKHPYCVPFPVPAGSTFVFYCNFRVNPGKRVL